MRNKFLAARPLSTWNMKVNVSSAGQTWGLWKECKVYAMQYSDKSMSQRKKDKEAMIVVEVEANINKL